MDAEKASLPVLKEPRDTLRLGLGVAAERTRTKHPVEEFQMNGITRQLDEKIKTVRMLHGIGAAMDLKAEIVACSQPTRLPGLPSSNVALDTLLNNDEKIRFEDVLGREEDRPDAPKFKLHSAMEIKFGML
uniref:Proteasome maturation factor UMP1 n=1 Tax=Pinguiococcus pyrenoidosus TaxID=172671 RepID=A0A7R9YBV5_9STRA|mmetsp:Transcript_19430/g.73410  ORF Transcript_19430/g.73410 Transcript_19430/m.73410 type:complete len:131 (+) Transcript_19430:112-504(+)